MALKVKGSHLLSFFVIIFVLISLPFSVSLVQKQQEIRKKAAEPTTPTTPITITPLLGDINGDKLVNIMDYNLLVQDFNKTGASGFSSADINKSGKVDIFDFNLLVENFGKTSAAQHQIGIRQGINGGEFYELSSGNTFVPRGNNYIRLAKITDPWSGLKVFYHSTFNPNLYNPEQTSTALAGMKQAGYNVVRVFINESNVGNPAGGISSSYILNVSDFLQKAKQNNLYVILTFPFLPREGGYYVANSNPDQIEEENWFFLSAEGVEAKKRYLKDFINGLIEANAPIEAIFSYNIENEAYFVENKKPFSLNSGLVKTANGQNYDMSDPSQKQHMMDAGLVFWINQIRSGIKEVDPTALVAPGFFSPKAVEGDDPRVIRTYWAIADSTVGGSEADYVDLHIYPGFRSLQEEIDSFEISSNKKPLVLGEFGAYIFKYPDMTQAAFALADLQISTCNNFKGWLAWTWDTTETASPDQKPDIYTVLDNNGAINGVLAPIVRPNPCL